MDRQAGRDQHGLHRVSMVIGASMQARRSRPALPAWRRPAVVLHARVEDFDVDGFHGAF
jgi:hypothetical protein